MSLKDFRILEPLGKGSFASVYKVSEFMKLLIDEYCKLQTSILGDA
jgi:hypothetical protein